MGNAPLVEFLSTPAPGKLRKRKILRRSPKPAALGMHLKRMGNLWLHRMAVLVSAATLALLLAGSAMTANPAVVSLPLHRILAGAVATLSLALALAATFSPAHPWLKRLAWSATAAVLAQAAVGSASLSLDDPRPAGVAHAALAILVFVLSAALAILLRPDPAPGTVEDSRRPSLHLAVALASTALWLENVLGATVRHVVVGIAPHLLGAAIATAIVIWAALSVLGRHLDHRSLRRAALWTLSLTSSQVFLGLCTYMSKILAAGAPQPLAMLVWFSVLHSAAGALALAASVNLTIAVFRYVRRPATAPAQGGIAIA
jgi:heme A synthase